MRTRACFGRSGFILAMALFCLASVSYATDSTPFRIVNGTHPFQVGKARAMSSAVDRYAGKSSYQSPQYKAYSKVPVGTDFLPVFRDLSDQVPAIIDSETSVSASASICWALGYYYKSWQEWQVGQPLHDDAFTTGAALSPYFLYDIGARSVTQIRYMMTNWGIPTMNAYSHTTTETLPLAALTDAANYKIADIRPVFANRPLAIGPYLSGATWIPSWHYRRYANDVSALKRMIAEGKIFVIVYPITSGDYSPTYNNPHNASAGSVSGYTAGGGSGAFKVAEGRGPSFGDFGYAWISYEFMRQMVDEAWEIIDVSGDYLSYYDMTYSGTGQMNVATTGITIVGGGLKDNMKIRLKTGYLQGETIPVFRTDGSFTKFYTEAPITKLLVEGSLGSLTTVDCSIPTVVAQSSKSIKMNDDEDSYLTTVASYYYGAHEGLPVFYESTVDTTGNLIYTYISNGNVVEGTDLLEKNAKKAAEAKGWNLLPQANTAVFNPAQQTVVEPTPTPTNTPIPAGLTEFGISPHTQIALGSEFDLDDFTSRGIKKSRAVQSAENGEAIAETSSRKLSKVSISLVGVSLAGLDAPDSSVSIKVENAKHTMDYDSVYQAISLGTVNTNFSGVDIPWIYAGVLNIDTPNNYILTGLMLADRVGKVVTSDGFMSWRYNDVKFKRYTTGDIAIAQVEAGSIQEINVTGGDLWGMSIDVSETIGKLISTSVVRKAEDTFPSESGKIFIGGFIGDMDHPDMLTVRSGVTQTWAMRPRADIGLLQATLGISGLFYAGFDPDENVPSFVGTLKKIELSHKKMQNLPVNPFVQGIVYTKALPKIMNADTSNLTIYTRSNWVLPTVTPTPGETVY
jgi:hypothetical protein